MRQMSLPRFNVSAQTDQRVGHPFRVTVEAVRPSGQPDHGYRGALVFKSTDPDAVLPGKAGFTGRESGRQTFTVTLTTPGVHRLEVTDPATGRTGQTSPLVVRSTEPVYHLYWGDLHGHAGTARRGTGAIDEFYLQARQQTCLDFCALTEPDACPKVRRGLETVWSRVQAAVRYYHEPGRFVPFLGYEWTGARTGKGKTPAHGHRQVLYLADDEPLFSSRDSQSDTLRKLFFCLAGKDAVTVAHHCAAQPPWATDWDLHEPEFDQLVEIYSSWGSSELPAASGNRFPLPYDADVTPGSETFVQAALARGYRVGLVAGSDSWGGLPDHLPDRMLSAPDWRPYTGGLTAVYAADLTREALWDAFLFGRTYATTGTRMLVDFQVNEEVMGSQVDLLDDDLVQLRGQVVGTADLAMVEVVKNNRVLHRYLGEGRRVEFTLTDDSPVESGDYYYLRAFQEDGHQAWSSPVWIE